jgi:hypothetical protein
MKLQQVRMSACAQKLKKYAISERRCHAHSNLQDGITKAEIPSNHSATHLPTLQPLKGGRLLKQKLWRSIKIGIIVFVVLS